MTTETTSPRYTDCMEELTALIKGKAPLIWVNTHEETRFIEEFAAKFSGDPLKRQIWLWSAYQGLVRYGQEDIARATGEENETWNPQRALARIVELQKPNGMNGTIFILRDFHIVLAEPIPRQIRDIYQHLIRHAKTLVITSPVLAHGPGGRERGLPPTLEKQTIVTRYALPTKDQIIGEVGNIIDHMKQNAAIKKQKTQAVLDYNAQQMERFGRALQGLTMQEIETSVSTCFTHMKQLSEEKMISDKRQIVRKSEILEFIDTPVDMNEVGGLDQAKEYLSKYGKAYEAKAKEFGVEPLKGVLFTGVPGSGKSLFAKAIGKIWGVPLLRLDVGKVMTGLVGGSEGKMREVIDQAQAMSPCILWIDEVEKSLAGTKSSNFSDGGTLARVFGTLLTAMQDGLLGVTIIATANDITLLPPEFIRRFNEVFFVDLPGPEERWEIFGIHLRKRGRDIKIFQKNKNELLNASEGYTGAEIEKAVKDAIAAAFYANKEDLDGKDLQKALSETKPISKVMAKKIETLRSKAKGTYRFASSWAEKVLLKAAKHEVTNSSGQKVDLDSALDDIGVFTKTKQERAKDAKQQGVDRFAGIATEEENE